MTTLHAAVFVDHQRAQVLRFDTEHGRARKIKAHSHHTKRHGSAVRSKHDLSGAVYVATDCTGLADIQHDVKRIPLLGGCAAAGTLDRCGGAAG